MFFRFFKVAIFGLTLLPVSLLAESSKENAAAQPVKSEANAGLPSNSGVNYISKLYAVIFGLTVNEQGQLTKLTLNRVIDPSSGSTDAVDVEVSDIYVESMRKFLSSWKLKPKMEDGKPVEFFQYFFYDPNRPEKVDIDPRREPVYESSATPENTKEKPQN